MSSPGEAPSAVWALITLGDEDRQYRGNIGYRDDARAIYRYDSFVPNSRRLKVGDIAILRDHRDAIGTARIERIDEEFGEKTQFRCPVCRTTGIRRRSSKSPAFRCDHQHAFDQPVETTVSCNLYAAMFPVTFVPTREPVTVSELRAANIGGSNQLAIQPLDQARLPPGVAERLGLRHLLLGDSWSSEPHSSPFATNPGVPYFPLDIDARTTSLREIRTRQGQARFRAALHARYGPSCMITGCSLVDVVEAAHIEPYRGPQDNHPENGLLLRADLHSMFDLHLLSVDPSSLRVAVHPSVRDTAYRELDGRRLAVFTGRIPSKDALANHWQAFVAMGGQAQTV